MVEFIHGGSRIVCVFMMLFVNNVAAEELEVNVD